jgi:uncharacterized protein (TIGR02145 family)
MKSLKFILAAIVAIAAFTTANAQHKVYVMKDKVVVYQKEVSAIDSIIFYEPAPPAPEKPYIEINGVKWAKSNVAAPGTFAENPEDYGMFYQWNRKIGWSVDAPLTDSNGGTTWDSSIPTGTEWETVNDPSPLGWRVPTSDELATLCETSKVSKISTTISGIIGTLFTDLQNGNTLFLPATGNSGNLSAKNRTYYWSSTNYNNDYAYYFGNNAIVYALDKATGMSLRCVFVEE